MPYSDTYTSQRLLSVRLPEQERSIPHVVGYRFAPDGIYSALRVVSVIALGAWMVSLLVLAVRRRRRAD